MLPKAHLTSHSRMPGSRWVITPLWLSGSWRSFLCSSSVYSGYLSLIPSASVGLCIISVLYCAHLCMKCSLGISNFLEEISSLSHPIVFLYLFTMITDEGFLISPCYSLELCIQMGISFPFSLPLASLLFIAICKASSDSHFAFLNFFFLELMILVLSNGKVECGHDRNHHLNLLSLWQQDQSPLFSLSFSIIFVLLLWYRVGKFWGFPSAFSIMIVLTLLEVGIMSVV